MQVATIESIIPPGGGCSRMILTLPDGKQNNSDLENLYSIGGIKFGNVQSNERAIIEKINQLTSEWRCTPGNLWCTAPFSIYVSGDIYHPLFIQKQE